MPGLSTVMTWLREDVEFQKQYARARLDQADYFADEIIELADEATNGQSAAAAKVKIDARIWHASKTNKTKYGEKGTEINVQTNILSLNQGQLESLQERRKKAEALLLTEPLGESESPS